MGPLRHPRPVSRQHGRSRAGEWSWRVPMGRGAPLLGDEQVRVESDVHLDARVVLLEHLMAVAEDAHLFRQPRVAVAAILLEADVARALSRGVVLDDAAE